MTLDPVTLWILRERASGSFELWQQGDLLDEVAWPAGFATSMAAVAAQNRMIQDQLDVMIAAGSGRTTTLTAQANSGQKNLVCASVTGLAVGEALFIGNSGSALVEAGVIASIASLTVTLVTNLTNTHVIGESVSASPVELVQARNGFATLYQRLGRDPVFNVKHFGALGNGVTDDTAAFNAAITACNAAGGGVVYVPPAVPFTDGYVISSTLVMLRGVSLWGAGRQSMLFLKSGSNCTMVKFPADVETDLYGLAYQNMRDLLLDGNKAGQGAGAWYGVDIEAEPTTPVNSSFRFDNVWVQRTKGSAWHLGNWRIGNFFTHCVGMLSDSYGWEVLSTDNHFVGCWGGLCDIGLYVNQWGNHVMAGHWFGSTGAANVRLGTSSRYCTVTSAGIDGAQQIGVLIEGEYNSVTDCTLGDNSLSAADTYSHIKVSTPKLGNTVKNNRFRLTGTRALACLEVLTTASVGDYGPNVMEPGAALYEAKSPVPVRMQIRPRATVRRTANKSIVTATLTAVDFDAEREDSHNFHDNATNNTRLSITADRGLSGLYRIAAAADFAWHNTGYREMRLKINGTTYIAIDNRTAMQGGASDATFMTIDREFYLNDGDYVELEVKQNSGGNLNLEAASAYSPELTISRVEG